MSGAEFLESEFLEAELEFSGVALESWEAVSEFSEAELVRSLQGTELEPVRRRRVRDWRVAGSELSGVPEWVRG